MKRLIAIVLILTQTFLFTSNSWATSTEQNNWQHKNSSLMPQSDPKGIWGPVQISIFAHPDSLILAPQINIPESKGLEKTLQSLFASKYESTGLTDIWIQILIKGLRYDILGIRDYAMVELAKLGEPAALALRDAANANPALIDIYIQALGDEDPDVQSAAVWGLTSMKELAIPALIETLGDPVRCDGATQALIGIGEPAAEPLIEALGAADTSAQSKAEIPSVLERIARSSSLDANTRERINRVLIEFKLYLTLSSDLQALRNTGEYTRLDDELLMIVQAAEAEGAGTIEVVDNPPYLFRTMYGLTRKNEWVFTGIKVNALFLCMPTEIRQAVLLHEASHIENIEFTAAVLTARREFEASTGISLEGREMTPQEFNRSVEAVSRLDSHDIEVFKQYFALRVHGEYLAWMEELRFFEGKDFDALLLQIEGVPNAQAQELGTMFYLTHQFLYNYSTHHGDIDGFDERRLKLGIADYFFSRDLPWSYLIAMLIEKREHGESIIGDISLLDWGEAGYMVRIEYRGGYLEQDSIGLIPVPALEYLEYLTNPAYYTP